MKRTILFIAILVASACNSSTQQLEPQITPGRYQLIQLGEFRRDQYLVDTHDGKLWVGTCFHKSNPKDSASCDVKAFDDVPVIKNQADRDLVNLYVELAKKQSSQTK